jgi:hypothetical protein
VGTSLCIWDKTSRIIEHLLEKGRERNRERDREDGNGEALPTVGLRGGVRHGVAVVESGRGEVVGRSGMAALPAAGCASSDRLRVL